MEVKAQDGGDDTRWRCRNKMEVKAERLMCRWRSRQRDGGVDVGKGRELEVQAQDGGVGTRWKCRHKMAQDGGVGTRDGGKGRNTEV